MSDDVKHYQTSATTQIQACRKGWRGAWDAIVAAWRKDDRPTVPETVTFSICIGTKVDPMDIGNLLRFKLDQGNEPLYIHGMSCTSLGDMSPSYISTGVRYVVDEQGTETFEFSPAIELGGGVRMSGKKGAPFDVGGEGIAEWTEGPDSPLYSDLLTWPSHTTHPDSSAADDPSGEGWEGREDG